MPVLTRPWPSAGRWLWTYPKPGEAWTCRPRIEGKTDEHIALVNGIKTPVGVAIAAELIANGADWAYSSEVFGRRLTLLDHTGLCVSVPSAVAEIVEPLRQEHGRWAGFPDAIAAEGQTVIMREAKVETGGYHDSLNEDQHAFASVAQRLLGERLDLAIVYWGSPGAAS